LIRVEDLKRSPEIEAAGWGNAAALVDARGLTIHGWAFGAKRTATAVEVRSQGEVLVQMPIGIERPDVAERFGSLSAARYSGFMATLRPTTAGASSIDLRVVFDDGSSLALGSVEAEAEAEDVVEPGRDGNGGWVFFQSPSELSRVLVGRQGWLFLRGDHNDANGQHTGRVRFGDQDRRALARLLETRAALAREAGTTWLTAIVPDKEMLYPEHLPAEIVPVEHRPVHDFLAIAERASAPATYLLGALQEAKQAGDLYLRTDTHWNYRGAYFAHCAICAELRRLGVEVDAVEEDSIEWWEDPFEGDLGGKLPHPSGSVDLKATLARSWGRRVYDNAIRNHGRVMIHEQDRVKSPSCLVFGESFAETLLYFLKESFGRVVFVHTSMFIRELVDIERPDVVLSLPIERFLIKVPDDVDALSRLAETAQEKGGELPWAAKG